MPFKKIGDVLIDIKDRLTIVKANHNERRRIIISNQNFPY